MATTFIQGLDNSKYSDFLTYLHNELSNGRDLFPTDLASAIAKASKWLLAERSATVCARRRSEKYFKDRVQWIFSMKRKNVSSQLVFN